MSGEKGSEWLPLTHVNGQPLVGEGKFKERMRTDQGLLLEIVYPAGVASPLHDHPHDSFIYLISGHLRGTLGGNPAELHPGGTLVHPAGVEHSVEAVADSHWLEFKAPPTSWAQGPDPRS